MGSESATGNHRIAVAVGNPDHVEQLMRTALDIATDRGGDVLITNVVTEPQGSPFRVFRDEVIKTEFGGDRREILDRALAAAEGTPVDVDGRLVVADSVGDGVVRVAAEFDADVLLLGWHARTRRDIVMGHIIDSVVADAPCDVLVEKIGPTADGVEAVLLPAGREGHTTLAAMVSRAIARANDARVDVVRVVDHNPTEAEREEAERHVTEVAAELEEVATETTVIESGDVVAALVEAAESRDVTVIGGGSGGRVRRLVVGSTAREVGRRARSTVIVATSTRGGGSRLTDLLS